MFLTLQQGHVYPLMFSITPSTGRLILLQKLISFLIVAKAISCEVVTIIAPSGQVFIKSFITVRCSSDVPGGVSLITLKKQKLFLVLYQI